MVLPKTLSLPVLSFLLLVLLGTAAARTAATRKALSTSAVYTVTATAYEAVAGQTDSKPFITADNSRIPRGYGSHTRWLALSRDLLRPWGGPFDFGDKVRVEGMSPSLDGVYTVHDTMNRRYRHRLDVLAHPREHLSLSRPGVKLRRVGPSHASGETTRTRPRLAGELRKAAAPRPHKAQPRPAVARHVVKHKINRQKSGKSLATTSKQTAHATKRQSKARRPVVLAHRKPRVARQLATSPKRPQQRRATTPLLARR